MTLPRRSRRFLLPLTILALSAPCRAASRGPTPAPHGAAETLSRDTLAWVGSRAVTAADLVRRIEWMPWAEKQAGAGMDSAKVHALQSLAGEELLAQEAEREGLGESASLARATSALRKALVRDELYREVAASAPAPSAARVDRIVLRRARHATAPERAAVRKAVTDSLSRLSRAERAAEFEHGLLAGQRAVVDSATFMLLADSLRQVMARDPGPGAPGSRHILHPEYMEMLLERLGPSLERPLVALPGEPLRLGEALEEFRFYAFSVGSLEPRPFAAELSARLRTMVEGELMAREGLRRHLDQRPEVRRDVEIWTTAWRARLLAARVAGQAATAELGAERLDRYVASLASKSRVALDYTALRRVDILTSDMLTKRLLGYGGGMLAAPSLPRLWGWVRIWRASHEARP